MLFHPASGMGSERSSALRASDSGAVDDSAEDDDDGVAEIEEEEARSVVNKGTVTPAVGTTVVHSRRVIGSVAAIV